MLGLSLILVGLTIYFAVMSDLRNRANTRQLLRDYAAFAAWSYRQHLNESLGESAWLSLNPIQHIDTHRNDAIPAASDLPGYRAHSEKMCHCSSPAVPATYFRFIVGKEDLQVEGPAPGPELAGQIITAIGQRVRQADASPRAGILRLAPSGVLTAYGTMPTARGDTVIYGFTFDSAGVVKAYDEGFDKEPLLPRVITAGRPNRSLLTLEVRDAEGMIRHRTDGWPKDEAEWPYVAAESLPPTSGGLVVRLAVRPNAAQQLLAGGLPGAPTPLLAATGLLAIGLALLALRLIRRETRLSRLRSDFVAGVSHELRTPLAQIRLFLDTLQLKRYDTQDQQEWLFSHLVRETTRLEHLVENVLAASRLDRGAPEDPPREPVDLSGTVRDTVTAFQPLADSRKATLVTAIDDGIGIMADRSGLHQLLVNLLDNAVKFGPPGQTVRIVLTRRDGMARLTVADEGPGVPAAERDRIWEPYFRGSGEAVRTVGGSGIGLAIVRQIATAQGGSAGVSDAAAGGAVFTIELPLRGEVNPQ
jgi:signal transduction histidine kinase